MKNAMNLKSKWMNKRRKNNTCINERKHEGNERINERGYSEYEAQ